MPTTLILSEAGSYTIEDDGTPGNATSVVTRDSDGSVVAVIAHPADSLIIKASVPGVNITLDITDSLGNGSLQVGDLADPGQSPDSIVVDSITTNTSVTLVANGSITEGGSDAAADIQAATIVMSAGTGIGTPGNAIETQTSVIEAETNTGGIAIGNVGTVQIGGLTDSVSGLSVATSGDLDFTNLGTITLTDTTGLESVHGGATSGDVNLTAIGFDSDITSTVNRDAISAPGGNITLTAGRDISFGTAGADFDNDVRANGTLTLEAGRDVLISGFADMVADSQTGSTGGNLVVNVGRNISILDDTGTDGGLATFGTGSIILTTGPNGLLNLETPFSSTVSSGGNVVVNADRMTIAASSGITAAGDVILRPLTDGRAIILGSASDVAAALELSDAELDRIVTSGTLTIGGDNAGSILVSALISPASVPNVTLRSGGSVNFDAGFTISGLLTIRAGDDLFQLGGSVITASDVNAFLDLAGDDGNQGGFVNVLGTITATTRTFTGNGDADTLLGSANDDVLNGRGGSDTMRGRAGNDIYIVDSIADQVIEGVGEGTDTVQAAVSWTLGDNVENLTMLGTGNINGIGNALANIITGNSGNNILDGAGGTDTLNGGLGNDTYTLADGDDTVTDTGGIDTITSTITRSLAALATIERLTLLGAGNINATGNDLANLLTGNSGNNVLNGRAGADTMAGLAGNDTYIVDSLADVVVETVGNGTDTVQTAVSLTLGDNFENLTLLGAGNLNGTGNGLANIMTGNSGNNILNGRGGADTMTGLAGNDTYIVDSVADVVAEAVGQGTDTVQAAVNWTLGDNIENLTLLGVGNINGVGNALNNLLTGNSGNNILNGAGGNDTINGGAGVDRLFGNVGNDTLTGGTGADTFVFQSTPNAATNVDTITDFSVADDTISLENSVFTTIGAVGVLAAAAFVRNTTGLAQDASDRII
uniref:beta strand repeat-containing protein n=1 Tax=Ciceribacter selenitireducens TaxID=448181 RepID=UPI000685E7E8